VWTWGAGLGRRAPAGPRMHRRVSGFMAEVEGLELDLTDLEGYPIAVAHGSRDP